jgi:ABC-type lipoprotein release transport system permease subunit
MLALHEAIALYLLHQLTNIQTAKGMAKTQDFTHVRVSVKNRERAKEIARQKAAKQKEDVHYTYLVDEILDKGLSAEERKLGIV